MAVVCWIALQTAEGSAGSQPSTLTPLQQSIVRHALAIMNEHQVTYKMGGADLSGGTLDCSHFVAEVFRRADLPYSYITTRTMLDLDAATLLKKYHLHDLHRDARRIQVGDLGVYQGHVVLVIAIHKPGSADIIHATSGLEIKGPGQGVQVARQVALDGFRGPLLRALRHRGMLAAPRPTQAR